MTRSDDHLVLGIESSCDETAAAVTIGSRRVLSNVIASQHDLHAEYRGVVPEIASRAHAERVDAVVESALRDAGARADQLHAVAIGNRPGLIGSLLVGVSAGKALAWSLGLPLVAVDHVHAHLYAGFMSEGSAPMPALDPAACFPAIGLVVSGGHTALYRLDSPSSLARIGSTRDDAVGEAYDKVAAILGLAYPGGPIVDRLARAGDERRFDLPRPRLEKDALDFTFSGLKTAVLYLVRGVPAQRGRGGTPGIDLTEQTIADVCAAFQRRAVESLMLRLRDAVDRYAPRTILVGGGVSANSRLRTELTAFASERGLGLALPPMPLCVDNGAMLAGLGHWLLDRRGWTSDPLSTAAFPSGAA